MKTLGIDLGSNSLGWAILSPEKIEDCGVIVFKEGILRSKGVDSLETPAAERRKHRMARRIKFRRRIRKLHVLKILIENNMCPMTMSEWQALKNNGLFPKNKEFVQWLKSTPSSVADHENPYYARAKAAEEKIDPMLLGRALYHLAQRRGFKSSRKDAGAVNDDSSSKAKDLGVVKKEIAELSAILKEENCTLGQYFYKLNQTNQKIRGKHISRVEHYQKEFEQIAKAQNLSEELKKALFQALFSQRPLRSQKHLVGHCLLEKQRSRCLQAHPLFELYRMFAFINTIKIDDGTGMRRLTAEEREKIKPEFFRKERSFDFERIIKALFPVPRGKKVCDLPVQFNYRPDKDVPSCRIAHQLNKLFEQDFLSWQYNYTDGTKTTVYNYQTVFDALAFYDDDTLLREFGKKRLGFDDEKADELIKIHLPEGYANYSLCAIKNILPFLKAGFDLSTAIIMAKLPDIMGKNIFLANSEKIFSEVLQIVDDYRQEVKQQDIGARTIPLNKRLRGYLEDEWKLLPSQIDQLYWASSVYSPLDETGKNRILLDKVQLGMIRNPMVQRSMTVLRKLVNDLRKAGKIDEHTHIHIELARTVNDRNHRMAWETWQLQKAAERKEARQELIKILHGKDPKEELIDKYILWQEQGLKCLYTGHIILQTELVSETSGFDIEHTVPRSRSGDNSMANKTLCELHFNRNSKKGCLPTECHNYETEIRVHLQPWIDKRNKLRDLFHQQMRAAKQADASAPDRKAALRQKALVTEFELKYWEKKVGYFEATADNLEQGFMNRQLVDTGIMTRHAVDFLRSVYPNTYPVNGRAVDWARRCWGLQDQYDKKERVDHTHHLLDAIIIAGLDRKRFQEICKLFKDDGNMAYDKTQRNALLANSAPLPYFVQAAKFAAESVCVKSLTRHNEFKQTHRKNIPLSHPHKVADGRILRQAATAGDTVRGQLHAETFYGLITSPGKAGTPRYVVRKFISDILTFKTVKDFDRIVDEGVRRAVQTQVAEYMANDISFKNAITEPLWLKKPDAEGKNGVPIIKVRTFADSITEPHILRQQQTPSSIDYKNYYYVNSTQGSNFRLALFLKQKKAKGHMVDYWDMQIDNILTHAKERKKIDYIPPEKRTDEGAFLGYIYQGCAVLKYEKSPDELKILPDNELQKRLYYLVKFEKSGRMTFKFHREARDAGSLAEYLLSQQKSKTGDSAIKFNKHQELLLISPSNMKDHLLFEGIHFSISLTGKFEFF